MSTRGTFGFHRNGKDELYYNHWDSYPDGLGAAFIDYLKNGKTESNWIEEIIANPKERNDEFIWDSLFCEYGYIMNYDTNELEVYTGFQNEPPEGRYHDYGIAHRDRTGVTDGYYACGLLTAIHMDTIKHFSTKELVDFIYEEEREKYGDGDN